MNKCADYLEYDVVLNKGKKLLNDDKKYIIGFYLIFSVNTGMRVGDILKLQHFQFSNLSVGDDIVLVEEKTKKRRKITLNNEVISSYKKLKDKLISLNKYNEFGNVFISQKGTVFSYKSINRIIKEVFNHKTLQISTHTMRKAFARRCYDSSNQSQHSLLLIADAFNHSSISITKRYLGLRQSEIQNLYLSL